MNDLDIETEKEFEDAIATHGGIIAKICYYFSSDSDEFQDLRQEVLLNIWRGWKTFRGVSGLSTWIYRVSFNTCISCQRKERKNTISINEVLNLSVDPETSKLERYNTMHKLISQLNFQERAIILMWLDEKSYDEISELMGIKRNTLAVKLKRIKDKLIRMQKMGE